MFHHLPDFRYSAGGFLTGAMYKFKQGPRASLAGGLVGGLLGTVAGIANAGILYITGKGLATWYCLMCVCVCVCLYSAMPCDLSGEE